MPEYHRSYLPGGSYFFTVVTYHRQPLLTGEIARNILHLAWEDVAMRYPFKTEAICLLPDHIHCLWTLPDGDQNYSLRWGEIKRIFTKGYKQKVEVIEINNSSRLKRGESSIWQRRFWEHTIRDDEDFYRHLDYIHYNPVKHGLVHKVSDWPWSSFHQFVKIGLYSEDWGSSQKKDFDALNLGE